MKLYIKQMLFTMNDKFNVYDEFGEIRYYVESELFTLGKKLHITDADGNEVAYIEQKVASFSPRYFVYVGDCQVAEIVKKFTLFKPRYIVSGPDWDVKGSFLVHDYEITKNGEPIVTIMKEWMTWGDTYRLDIADEHDEITALAVVITIDCVVASQQ